MADIDLIEAATASLVREYLSRKGLKSTLEKMDEEFPRTEQSISNRQALMKYLHLDKLMKKNKEQIKPLKAMLEIMTRFFMERRGHSSPEQKRSDHGFGVDSLSGISSTIDFSPQMNEPEELCALKQKSRPTTAALKLGKGERNDLVLDDNVEGETLMGSGKSGLISGNGSDAAASVSIHSTKSYSNRPVSAKSKQMAGAIISNSDHGLQRRLSSQANRPKSSTSRQSLSLSQQNQQPQLVSSLQSNTQDMQPNGRSFPYKDVPTSNDLPFSISSTKVTEKTKKLNHEESSPVSFEALLLKGEERANLLQRIGMDKKSGSGSQLDESYSVDSSSMGGAEKSLSQLSSRRSDPTLFNTQQTSDLEIGEVDDDLDIGVSDLQVQRPSSSLQKPKILQKIPSSPIDIKTAINLKNLVLGSPCQWYNDEWLLQSFCFSDMPDLKYGIVQKKGGPCGVLAAVQACLLQEMLFGQDRLAANKRGNPSRQERSQALARALANLLWRAGSESRAVITLPSDSIHLMSSSKFKQDDVTEKLSLYTFTDYQELSSFLMQSVSQFENDGNPGVILTMYSAILSRKPHQVKSDFDSPDCKMIAAHGYCTQELVNLLLTGRAVSNVFNDTMELGSDEGSEQMILKGPHGRSDIGLLSLFEHYRSCQVGTYYKTPKYPIWVVCSESHFSVLFSTRKDLVNDWKAEKRFDLYYYDGLAKQQEEIKLTISNLNRSYNHKAATSEEDLVPPLELCIRTKWSDAEIDWNGYDPIL